MNYSETMDYIEKVSQYGSVLGLENIKELLNILGNPQDELTFIHIAGTNGKGSVLAYISTVLKEGGYKVGRYISPVIFDYRERIQINGELIKEKELADYMTRIKAAADQMIAWDMIHPTVFEIETALAFLYFKEQHCEIVVLETGLGGLTDATNIIKNTALSVFTSISMDHMAFLGNTLAQIAENKAGIIKPGCKVITAEHDEDVMNVLKNKCDELSCPMQVVRKEDISDICYGLEKQKFSYKDIRELEISLPGLCQITNAALALDVLEAAADCGYPVSLKSLRRGFAQTSWMGRFTVISKNPYFIIDGAHNEDAAKKLSETVQFYFTNRKVIYIIGVLKDKEYEKIVKETCSHASDIITVTPPGNIRALPAEELAKTAARYHEKVTSAGSLEQAVDLSYSLADKDSVIVAFGSLSYLGELCAVVDGRKESFNDGR